jgi:hypothetical protein
MSRSGRIKDRVASGWKGVGDDARMFHSSSADGVTWTGETLIGGFASHDPTLAATSGRLHRGWKYSGADSHIFISGSQDAKNIA